jgi:Low psii accumulation1 / Rep27
VTELKPKPSIDPELLRRLRAEAKSPYRGLRQFIYVSCLASGSIGGIVFFFKVAAGRDLETSIPNLALQAGVVAVMGWLLRIDRHKL